MAVTDSSWSECDDCSSHTSRSGVGRTGHRATDAATGYDVTVSSVTQRLSRILPRQDQCFLVAAVDGHFVGWLHRAMAEFIESPAFVVIGGLVSIVGRPLTRTLSSRTADGRQAPFYATSSFARRRLSG
jgi:hypothetical protein